MTLRVYTVFIELSILRQSYRWTCPYSKLPYFDDCKDFFFRRHTYQHCYCQTVICAYISEQVPFLSQATPQ